MRLPKNDSARGQAGEVGKANSTTPTFSDIGMAAVNLCLCREGRTCGWCHLQNRSSQAIHESLRRQAIGEIGGVV